MTGLRALQLKFVTVFFDKILYIDWKWDEKNNLESCIIYLEGSDMMGTQGGLGNQIMLDKDNGMVELRQFLDATCRFDGLSK